MNSARFLTVFALAAVGGFAIANCGGSDDSSNNGLTCPGSTSSGSCNAEQTKAYGECVQNKCDAQYKACLGDGYRSGSFGGVCATYIGCYAKCNCDKTCQAACPPPSAECTACFFQVAGCQQSSGCPLPTCGTGGTGGGGSGGGGAGGSTGGATCADLTACCNSMADAQMKAQCQQAAAGVMSGGNAACSQVLNIYKASGLCK